MTDFRALCAELVDALHNAIRVIRHEDGTLHISTAEPVLERARAALAQPAPEGPTDEDIMGLMPQQMHEDLAAAVRALAEQAGTDSSRVKGMMRIMLNRHAVDLARAVLARWGTFNLAEIRSSLGDGPAVSDDREPASVDDNLALRVQRLEAMRETEQAALLDAFKQIDKLQGRLDFHYTKLHRLEEAAEDGQT
jgi:hypothetical protein